VRGHEKREEKNPFGSGYHVRKGRRRKYYSLMVI